MEQKVAAYSHENSDISTEGTDVIHHERRESFEESSDSKEYEVKECVTEYYSAQIPLKLNLGNTAKEQNVTLKNIRTGSKGKVPRWTFHRKASEVHLEEFS